MRPFRRIPPELAHQILRFHDRFIPIHFDNDIDGGAPQLTAEGRKAIEEELAEDSPYPLETAPAKPT